MMFNPLIDDLSTLKVSDLEAKNTELTKKYNMAMSMGKPYIAEQIVPIMLMVKDELNKRHNEAFAKAISTQNKNIKDLIKTN